MLNEKVFDQLKERFGSDAKAAEALGVSPRHYSRVKIAKKAKPSLTKLICLYAETDNQEDQACDTGV